MTRRFLFGSLAAASLSMAATAQRKPVRFGGPIFLKSDDPRELAREHRRLGYSAAYCPKAEIKDTAGIKAIRTGVRSRECGHRGSGRMEQHAGPRSPRSARENLHYVTERSRSPTPSAPAAVSISPGSYNPKVWYGPDPKNLSQEFFDATVENCRRLIDAVKPTRTKFTIEMMGWNLPDGPDSYLKLIKAVDRQAFGVHMDVCNGVNSPTRFYQNAEFIRECFEKLGPWIASCHAKDLAWITELNVHFQEVIPGPRQDRLRHLSAIAREPACRCAADAGASEDRRGV